MMSKKTYVKAILLTFLAASLLVFIFAYWKEKTFQNNVNEKFNFIERLEKEGLTEFQAETLENKKIDLDFIRGKVVIVSFWASWCGPCIEEFPSMIDLVEKTKGQVQLIAISQDNSENEILEFLKAFPGSRNPSIHVVFDKEHRLASQFESERLPESFIFNKQTKLAKKIVGSIQWNTPEAIEYMKKLLED